MTNAWNYCQILCFVLIVKIKLKKLRRFSIILRTIAWPQILESLHCLTAPQWRMTTDPADLSLRTSMFGHPSTRQICLLALPCLAVPELPTSRCILGPVLSSISVVRQCITYAHCIGVWARFAEDKVNIGQRFHPHQKYVQWLIPLCKVSIVHNTSSNLKNILHQYKIISL